MGVYRLPQAKNRTPMLDRPKTLYKIVEISRDFFK